MVRKLHSIQFKFFAAVAAIALVFITLISILNVFFYDDYYLTQRRESLTQIYQEIRQDYTGDVTTQLETLFRMENNNSVRLSIVSADGRVKYDSTFREDEPTDAKHLFSSLALALSALRSTDRAEMARTGMDLVTVEQGSDTFLCLVGILGTDYLIAREPFAFMEENSMFNSTFLLITGFISLFICLILSAFVASRFTRPLIEMEGIASAMSRLDFSKRYEGTVHDEIGQLGESLNLLSDHLEQAIQELRTSNTQLGREIAEKERIDAMRREFIVNVSHELKTPIALIQGYAEGLTAGVAESDEDRAFYCETIAEEADRMNRMVSQLLSLSKLELGRETLCAARVQLGTLLQEVVEKTHVLWQERGLQVHCALSEVTVETDVRLVEQIVMNYMTNAIRYTPMGGQILLQVHPQADGGAYLTVFNEGEGVAEAELPLLWEKFYRTDKARSRASGGTGVGLSIVRASATLLGGRCDARNVPNGIEFSLYLPARLPQSKDRPEKA